MAKVKSKVEKKSVAELMKEINEAYGDNSSVLMSSVPKLDVDVISTGSISLDMALGVGGLPRGRIVEVFGPESSGKTTLALSVIAQAQKNKLVAAYVDAEHALDPDYCKALGVDTSKLVISQPSSGEEALNILQKYVESGAIDVVVVDSVAMLVPTPEVEGDTGAQFMGLQARMMSQAMRKLTPVISNANTLVIFINQIRMKIGVSWGSPYTTPGGVALKFASSVRLDIQRINTVKDKKGDSIGNTVKVKVAKNKVSAPFKTTEFVISFGKGIDYALDVLDAGIAYQVIDLVGNTFSFKGSKIGVGRDACRVVLQNDAALRDSIVAALLSDEMTAAKTISGKQDEIETTGDKEKE